MLTFCTNGVLLRTLMGGENPLQSVTHLIIDEVQENDRFSEFLLLIMKQMIVKFRSFKLILISSNLRPIHYYSRYFNDCPIIEVPSVGPTNSHFFFLEDVLMITAYMSEGMQRYKEIKDLKETQKQILNEWFDDINISKFKNECSISTYGSGDIGSSLAFQRQMPPFGSIRSNRMMNCENLVFEREELDVKLRLKMDSHLKNAWTEGTDYAFEQLFDLIISEHISVDYQHSVSGVTALIAAASHNRISYVEALLSYGANIELCTPNDWNALQWALHFKHKDLAELLETYCKCLGKQTRIEELSFINNNSIGEQLLTAQQKEILDIYYHSLIECDSVELDIDLICHLIDYIITNGEQLCPQQKNGSILIFLAGYEEIVKLREKILNDSKRFDANKNVLFTLYSQMPNNDLRRVFRRMPSDVRKIIISTDIGESLITIDDVIFIIDSGKTRKRIFDNNSGFAYNVCQWISKTNAFQRRIAGNSSKDKICFHLYDKNRFNALDDFPTPDLQKMTIFELCLQSKLLAPNFLITDFLSKAANPPPMDNIRRSNQLLRVSNDLRILLNFDLHYLFCRQSMLWNQRNS